MVMSRPHKRCAKTCSVPCNSGPLLMLMPGPQGRCASATRLPLVQERCASGKTLGKFRLGGLLFEGRSPFMLGRSPLMLGRSPLMLGRSPFGPGRPPFGLGRSPNGDFENFPSCCKICLTDGSTVRQMNRIISYCCRPCIIAQQAFHNGCDQMAAETCSLNMSSLGAGNICHG